VVGFEFQGSGLAVVGSSSYVSILVLSTWQIERLLLGCTRPPGGGRPPSGGKRSNI
jgi:hypothetical protein